MSCSLLKDKQLPLLVNVLQACAEISTQLTMMELLKLSLQVN